MSEKQDEWAEYDTSRLVGMTIQGQEVKMPKWLERNWAVRVQECGQGKHEAEIGEWQVYVGAVKREDGTTTGKPIDAEVCRWCRCVYLPRV